MSQNITIRTLHEDELEAWFTHVTECFSKKVPPTPKEYFVTHFKCDPFRDINTIVVAIENDQTPYKQIISTARIFLRQVYVSNNIYTLGGLGEVCTKESYRGKGIAKLVLDKTNEIMRNRRIQIGSLHTGSNLGPFYSKFGYQSVPLRFAFVEIKIERVDQPHLTLLALTFEDEHINQVLVDYHAKYASQHNGVFVRDTSYWSNWMSGEIHNPHRKNTTAWLLLSDPHEVKVENIVAYGVIKLNNVKDNIVDVFVRDYIVNTDHKYSKIAFKNLLYAFLRHSDIPAASAQVCECFIAHERDGLVITDIYEENGFMYQLFDSNIANNIVEFILGTKQGDTDHYKHAFQFSDSY
jgi:predicted GNAT family N-acyltransferase